MTIVETLAIQSKEGLFESLSSPLNLNPVEGLDFPVYRLEINPEMVILIYQITGEQEIPDALWENIHRHLKAVLFISERDTFGDWEPSPMILDKLLDLEERTAMLIALESDEDWTEQIPDYISQKGLFLGEKARLLFWQGEDRDSQLKVWEMVWGELLKPA
ncbi:MAG: hypothetical protein Kow0042_06440 [Calditrichia bacterium]